MNYEQTQNALLILLDSLKHDMDSSELSILSGSIGAIHADQSNADKWISRAVLAIGHALGKVNNDRGFKYGLSLAGKALRTMPPIVELIDSIDSQVAHSSLDDNDYHVVSNILDKHKPTVFDCQVLDTKELK